MWSSSAVCCSTMLTPLPASSNWKAAASGAPRNHNKSSRLIYHATDEIDQDKRMMQVPRGMVLSYDMINILRQSANIRFDHKLLVPPNAFRGKLLRLPSSQVIEEVRKLKSTDFSHDTKVMQVYLPKFWKNMRVEEQKNRWKSFHE